MKKGMPMREAYRKAGYPPEDMDWEAMGMDIRTCGKELTIRPARYASRGLSAWCALAPPLCTPTPPALLTRLPAGPAAACSPQGPVQQPAGGGRPEGPAARHGLL
jgi:hypothetical protein